MLLINSGLSLVRHESCHNTIGFIIYATLYLFKTKHKKDMIIMSSAIKVPPPPNISTLSMGII